MTKKILIDTDCGVDDSIAILMALLCEDCEVVGITCVHGNATRDSKKKFLFSSSYNNSTVSMKYNNKILFLDVLKNVGRVLKHANKTSVPIFSGCAEPMIKMTHPMNLWEGHGPTGLGSAPPEDDIPQPSSTENAAQAIIRLSKENDLHIITLGPLTNLALAALLDPELPKRVLSLTSMGGTMDAHGNYGLASEFNFSGDPEAARIVLERFPLVNILPWETMYMSIPWKDFDNYFEKVDGKILELTSWMTYVLKDLIECERGVYDGVYLPDACAMHALIRPESVTDAVEIYGAVETAGELTRGAIFYDWSFRKEKHKNVRLIRKMNINSYIEDLRTMFHKGSYKL